MVNIPELDISSSVIRQRAAKGQTIRYLTPDAVADYIEAHGLYSPVSHISAKEIKNRLKRSLPEKRYSHTLSVADEARRLAAIHGANGDKAYLAGLLHDAAKGLSDAKLLEKAVKYGIALDPYTRAHPGIIHGMVAAETAKADYGVSDEDVLNAVRYHTTGRPGMSLLEKIVFTADYIEPGRAAHSGLVQARECADHDLDAAVICALTATIERFGAGLHPISRQARDYLIYHFDKEDY
jgi:nicotinate-nucleotide adenylyltransferase